MILTLSASLILCIILSAFFSGSEMALSSANIVRLENMSQTGSKKASNALFLIRTFDKTLCAILIGNNLVNIAASSIGSVIIILLLGESKVWISTIAVTVLIIIFGETIPKIKAKRNASDFATQCAGPVRILRFIFYPVNFFIVMLVKLITRPVKTETETVDSEETVEELQSIIETAEDEGVIDSNVSEIVQNAIDFSDISASEVMTARVDVQAINIDDSWDEIMDFIDKTPYSRIPVFEDSIDNIIGVLHLNRLFTQMTQNGAGQQDIRQLLMTPCYVYKTMKLPKVLSILKNAKQHLAVVTDEYSGTLGVVSMEDVLEQIVGEIWDETDIIEKDDVIRQQSGEIEIDGDLPISELPTLLNISDDEFDAQSDTAGGWVIEKLEHFPESGEHFEYASHVIKVLESDGMRVLRIKIS